MSPIDEEVTPSGGVAEAPSPDSQHEPPGEVSEPEAPLEPEAPQVEDRPEPDPVVNVDDEEIIEPKLNPVERRLDDGKGNERVYIQKPMGYFQKIELYGLLGRGLEIVMQGEAGLGIDELLKASQPKNLMDQVASRMPGYEDAPDRTENEIDVQEASKMLAAFSRLVSLSPDLLKEAYCLILDIPKVHRNWAMEWALPHIDDDTGDDILNVFIDQNWGIMEDFFIRRIPATAKRAAQDRKSVV